MERFKNNAASTLSSGVNNSSDPVTVAVASATPFPTDGNFRIKIDNEILKVTAVSGTNFTAVRAQEGTTIASHSSGVAVTLILTNESLDQTIKDRFKVGVLDNYAVENAREYQGSDAPAVVHNGATVFGMPYVPLRVWDSSSYTWFSQGGSTVTKNSDFMSTFSVPYTAGEQLRGMHIATSGTTTIDAWFQSMLITDTISSFHLMGVNFGNGSNAKKYAFRVMNHSSTVLSLLFQYFTDDTTATTSIAQYRLWPQPYLGLRLAYNSGGDTIAALVSHDGLNWVTIGTASSVSGNFTPDRAGIHFENNGGLTGYYNVSNVYIR